MSSQDELIDKIDMELFRVLGMAYRLKSGKKNAALIAAIQHARSLSEALLPDETRRALDRPPSIKPLQGIEEGPL